MACNMTPISVAISNWIAGGDGKVRGSDPGGLLGYADIVEMSMTLATAGRLGFYVDYSELATTGTHTFYVARTHGSAGAVSCGYSFGGDANSGVSGTLNWADGEMNIKTITATVSSKSAGDHRMWCLLDTPTGGAALHFGAAHTRAYGVIDDGTIAADSDAVFYDSAASGGGDGSQASPYNSIYTARDNLGTKRYLYGKGTTVPDLTDGGKGLGGTAAASNIEFPATRSGEATRCYVRNWPGFTWDIDGATETTNGAVGFVTENSNSYITFRGLDFKNLDGTVTGTINGAAIMTRTGNAIGTNIEYCTADNINGTANNAAFALWDGTGSKVWRSTSNNIQTSGDNTHGNTGGVYSYRGEMISVQRCEFSNSAQGCFQKQTEVGEVSMRVAFCHFKETLTTGVHYSTSGSGDPSHENTMVHSNVFETITNAIDHASGYNDSLNGGGHAWFNNVFNITGAGVVGTVHFNEAFSLQMYNNIYTGCHTVWQETNDSSGLKTPGVEFSDYNVDYNTQNTGFLYRWKNTNYATAAALNTASGLEANTVTTDPLFTNPAADDYTLQGGSPALTGGVSGNEQGLYLAGIEVIGA